jgi:hypothetical protein
MRQRHCASRNAMESGHRALSGAPRSSDIPGLGDWSRALNRVVRDHDPERQFQSHARPMYLIKINVLQFPFQAFAKLETGQASFFLQMKCRLRFLFRQPLICRPSRASAISAVNASSAALAVLA